MKRSLCLIIFLGSLSLLHAQFARNMMINLPSKTMPGQFYSKIIAVFPYYYSDSVSDLKMIHSFLYLPPVKHGPYYVLWETDTMRYAVTIERKGPKGNFIVKHFQPDGSPSSCSEYDPKENKTGNYAEYFPGKGFQVHGQYKSGKQEGEWLTFNDNGDIIDIEIFKDGKSIKDDFQKSPKPNKFNRQHHGYETEKYQITDMKGKAELTFKDTISPRELHGLGGMNFSVSDMSLGELSKLPYMLALPNDLCAFAGANVNIGKRNGFFGTVQAEIGFTKQADGTYQQFLTAIPLHVKSSVSRFSFMANYPIYGKGNKFTFYGTGGLAFSGIYAESKVTDASYQGASYFLKGRVKQNFLFHIGLRGDLLGKGTIGPLPYSLSFNIGYNIGLLKANWHNATGVNSSMPDVGLGGLIFGLEMDIWNSKLVKKK